MKTDRLSDVTTKKAPPKPPPMRRGDGGFEDLKINTSPYLFRPMPISDSLTITFVDNPTFWQKLKMLFKKR